MLLLDTGFLYAMLDRNDNHHAAVRPVVQRIREPILLPTVVTTEVAYLVRRELGSDALARFLEMLAASPYLLVDPLAEDYQRAAQIVRKYDDSNVDFVDVLIVAMSERLNITTILTIDQRHFRMFRPRHVSAFTLLP